MSSFLGGGGGIFHLESPKGPMQVRGSLLIMINDLSIGGVSLWKYLLDTANSETVLKNHNSKIQQYVDDLSKQVSADRFQLNEDDCKELRITFPRSHRDFDPLGVNTKNIECVKKAKIQGVTLSSDIKWNDHVYKVIKKVHKRLHFLSQLKRAQVKSKELTTLYITCIRPVMECA